ncbi:protein kinase domain-containing protein [Blastococcus mobilis]|uniref:non-specific serine/threonine protein kinase n=1 Tax=Blastococcus mobilis TaxID=1938746 RepID=A0A238YPP9_9ACTN|nr:protein kinase [Blastococcus mobilis]SNR72644.1 serine/threonine protein kinase [Blastococcus mobilis]
MHTRGRLLGNRYELLMPIASGGMGRVWRARDTLLERPVAVKVLRSELTGDSTFRARFRAEAQHTAALHHPNIASVFDYGELEEDGEQRAYLVMELVEGETLSTLLEREGRLDAARTLGILRQMSGALAAAHAAGVVHRDVKPGNVLVGTDGVVKITDFGIAWSASSVPLTGTGQVVGTAHYLAPEQAAGSKATPASDVYALGVVAYECLTGRRAFDGENSVQIALKQIREEPAPLPPDVPAGLRAVVERAMLKDPAARFPDGAALHAALDGVTDVSPAPRPAGRNGTAVLPLPLAPAATPGAPAAEGVTRRRRRVPVPMLLGALAALVVIAVVVARAQTGAGTTPAEPAVSEATTAPPAPTTPATVALVAAELLGRPVEEVHAELLAHGLQVQLAPVETADVAAGQVTAVAPEGELAPGALVTVAHAVAPPPPPAENPKGEGDEEKDEKKGNGRGNDKKDDD